MSPEQIGAVDDIDHRTDLYAMGCLLFECLASRPPYVHKNENVVLQMHRLDPIPNLKAFREDAPEDLVQMITRALAKNREERWRSAGEMAGVMVE
jgi:serine/threonine-protein kinase